MDKLKELFQNPSAEFRTAPLWVWNSKMSDSEIEKMLGELKSHGFGGAFVHPRPGMKVSYLDEAYFGRWKKALETAKKLGLLLNIYDENSYPSGFGGGQVSSELPDCLSEAVKYQVFSEREMDFMDEAPDWLGNHDIVAVYACEKVNGKMAVKKELTEIPRSFWKGEGSYYAVLTHLTSQTAGWLAGFADIDRLRPEVAAMFLDKVYGQYAKHFSGEFGETIKAIFTDEPSLPGSTVYGRGGLDSLPVNHWFAYEFQKLKGYDIMKFLPSLFEDYEGVENEKIRFDYYEVTYELWVSNFLRPIRDWCSTHHIKFTGHFMEDGWPKPFYCVVSPGVMSYYEYQDWPGIDLLLTGRLKDGPEEVQEISILEVMSAAHQFGKERVFCEAFGAGGYDSGLADYKRIGDYLLVNGVNYINEHLSYTSYVGARKRDHPQSFDWRQSWWEDYTCLNDYFARLCACLSAGESRERFLVLNPTMTGYLYPKNADSSQLVYNVLAKEPDTQSFLKLVRELKRKQWDISLGDENIMKRHGKAKAGCLQIVRQNYDAVILHECVKNMLPETLKLLEEFLDQGGCVLSVGRPGDYVAGSHNPEAYAGIFSSPGYMQFATAQELTAEMERRFIPYFTGDREWPEGVRSLRRELEGGQELYFITNHSKEEVDANAEFRGTYIEQWDPWSGTNWFLAKASSQGEISVPVNLKEGESKLLCVFHDECREETRSTKEPSKKGKYVWKPETVKPLDRNTWPLEYCDLTIDGQCYRDYSVILAGIQVFRQRGFLANPWDNEVQYKTRTYDRNRFYPENSGFSAAYRFNVAKGYKPAKLTLCVEYGERYDVFVNGKQTGADTGECFLDELIREYDICDLVQGGENEILIKARRFDVELELEAVILRGSFGVYNREGYFVMDAPGQVREGSWLEQGYPFYSGTMSYEGALFWDGKEKTFILASGVEGTACSLWVNGEKIGTLNLNGIREREITSHLQAGKNQLLIRVCGSMKNLLGPHFDTSIPRNTAWPDMWKKAPAFGQPSADDYDLIEYGMREAVVICKR